MRKFSAVLIASIALALTACAKDVAPPALPSFTYTNEPAFTLKGTQVTVENAYTPSRTLPSVESSYRLTPADIARAWAHDRLHVTGKTGLVTLRILEASVVEDTLPTQHGYVGYLAGEQNRQFTARLRVEILMYSGSPNETTPGRVTAEATASRPVAASAGPNGAEVDYYALLQSLSDDFDKTLSAQMSAYLVGL